MSVMRIPLEVTYINGGEAKVVAYPMEMVLFEREFSTSVGVMNDPEARRMEHLLFLSYAAAKRDGETRGFDEWASTVAGVEIAAEEEDGSDPLDLTPSTGSSQS